MLIPYGKLSMTNYVTQGIIGSAIFYHWDLYARMGITPSVFVGVAIFLVQYVLLPLLGRPTRPRPPRVLMEARHMDLEGRV